MSKHDNSLISFLSTCLCNSLEKPATTILFLVLTAGAFSATAQGLQPASPTQEFIYFGGRLIAVEERGPGGNGSNAVKTPAKAGLKSADSAPVPVPGIAPPAQPSQPVVPPQDTTGAAAPLAVTPVNTHVASPVQQ